MRISIPVFENGIKFVISKNLENQANRKRNYSTYNIIFSESVLEYYSQLSILNAFIKI